MIGRLTANRAVLGNTSFFQFDYDWRRDIVESAKKLDIFIKEKKKYVQIEIEKRFGIKDYDVKFDIVAHSFISIFPPIQNNLLHWIK